jgi:argininosuccinate lyase
MQMLVRPSWNHIAAASVEERDPFFSERNAMITATGACVDRMTTKDGAELTPRAAPGQSIDTFPAPVYRRTVLEELFRNAKLYFLEPLMAIQGAHTLMLAVQKIIPEASAAICLRGLRSLDLEAIRAAAYDPTVEDLYFYLEKKLVALCGAEHAGCMPVARSRNDVDMAMYRMVLRARTLAVIESFTGLRAVLVDLAWTHRAALLTAYTHQQPAQPTTLGHYLMASVEWMERDVRRLRTAYDNLNQSPLGACAITGTGFPIDRQLTAAWLGFDGVQQNTYGAIASVDYLTEACAALMVSMINLGRLMQDLLLWSTAEFAYLTLSDAFVQVSSIMPQKRNPVALEHVRVLASRALLQAQGVLSSLHNTPFADMNDAEDDLQPTAYTAFDDAVRALDLAAGVLQTARFNTEIMERQTHNNFLTVTELADVLVRACGVSFRTAHEVVSRAVKAAAHSGHSRSAEALIAALQDAFPECTNRPLDIHAELLHTALEPSHFVNVRKTFGGPSLEVLTASIQTARENLSADRAWLTSTTGRLARAEQQLEQRIEAFLEKWGTR